MRGVRNIRIRVFLLFCNEPRGYMMITGKCICLLHVNMGDRIKEGPWVEWPQGYDTAYYGNQMIQHIADAVKG